MKCPSSEYIIASPQSTVPVRAQPEKWGGRKKGHLNHSRKSQRLGVRGRARGTSRTEAQQVMMVRVTVPDEETRRERVRGLKDVNLHFKPKDKCKEVTESIRYHKQN